MILLDDNSDNHIRLLGIGIVATFFFGPHALLLMSCLVLGCHLNLYFLASKTRSIIQSKFVLNRHKNFISFSLLFTIFNRK